jgi:hypothetical protein
VRTIPASASLLPCITLFDKVTSINDKKDKFMGILADFGVHVDTGTDVGAKSGARKVEAWCSSGKKWKVQIFYQGTMPPSVSNLPASASLSP